MPTIQKNEDLKIRAAGEADTRKLEKWEDKMLKLKIVFHQKQASNQN